MDRVMTQPISWTDIEEIAIALYEAHPGVDPVEVRFTQLRAMVEALADFKPLEGQHVNEQILEAIQSAWLEEIDDQGRADDDGRTYAPNNPYR